MMTMLEIRQGRIGEIFSAFLASVGESFSHFTFFDALDILFLTALFFFLFRFFRSRKAGALLIGIAICALVLFVSYLLGMSGTYFLLSAIFEIGVLALIILFQPEIRDALERIGSGSISGLVSFGDKKKKQQYQSAIENICTAVGSLAASKTGALLVIGRTTRLDDITQTGIAIHADVNSFLLRNLFYNKAPLHDGAVVINDARIEAAGCLLPLTRRTDIDSDLGTRHRAAIGMSESSDAIVIVVSEETGTVSVAYDCALTRDYTPETLHRFLVEHIPQAGWRRGGEE